MTEIVVLVRCNKFCQQRVLAKLSEQPNCRGEEQSSLHIQCSEKKSLLLRLEERERMWGHLIETISGALKRVQQHSIDPRP